MTRLRTLTRRLGSLVGAGAVVAGCAWLVANGAAGARDGTDGPPAVLARAGTDTHHALPVDRVDATPGATSTTAAPAPASPQPWKLGDDPAFDDLWHGCQQGSGAACDQLFLQAPVGSDYETFGLSCGNRPDVLHCTAELDTPPTTVPPPTFPPPPGVATTR